MKSYMSVTAILCLIMFLCPLMTLCLKNKSENKETITFSTPSSEVISENDSTQSQETITVLNTTSGKIAEVQIYDYVLGVLASEMPHTYHQEALKAQAVAIYTYALWVKENSDNSQNELYDITNSSKKHQSYKSEVELKEKLGENYESCMSIYKRALNSVLSEYLSYNNEPILSVYHAISSGNTESSKTVWQSDLPYLKSTTSPGDTLSPDYEQTKTFTKDEFFNILQKGNYNITKDDIYDFSHKKSESSDYTITLTIGKASLSGVDVMSLFYLPSPNFTLEYTNESFVFKTKGKGHGVGMSQYSADYMARQGSTYEEILLHFYKGVKLVK